MYSNQYELDILRTLNDTPGGYAGPVQLSERTRLKQWTVKSTLSELRRRGMVERGGRGHWGEWSITERGLEELATAAQTRLEVVR